MDWPFLFATAKTLLTGVPLTLRLAATSLCTGFVLAVGIAALAGSRFAPARWLAALYVMLFQGTPLLVQIFIVYYGFGQIDFLRASFAWPFLQQAYWCAILALSLNTSAYGAEIIRGAIAAVPAREIEAARAMGMSGLLLRRRIIWPQALQYGLANYGNEAILLLKATSLASVITLMDVTGLAYRLVSKTYRSEEIFTVAGLIYLALTFVIATGVHFLERRLTPCRRV
ncbi:ABC transporter permease [Gluconobacter oxydans]|uniref:ABC transporter permease n=2 Tax=Gluconobacter oxydans TaxID=442 RepID=A0AB34XFK0_GLUOY|nr:ABC transporter permease subunit [Gluconobacter oxydans]AHK71505.1 putative octopine/nopaline transport system permease protein OccM [Gluconobacter oxydans DSM 3504]KXV07430.1 ABC transporter permease [Gluconobacter oxydans]